MARTPSLSEKQRSEWRELLRLSNRHHNKRIFPTKKFVDMYRFNDAHWAHSDADQSEWPYDRSTVNLSFARVKNVLPRTLARHPKVLVKPRSMATGRADRLGGQDAEVRWAGAASVQQLLNWRLVEFDFKQQAERVQLDNMLRGMGGVRHGFAAETDKSYVQRDREIEFVHHKHIRPGWPFAIYWPLENTRFDSLARSVDEMRWIAFSDSWRLDDLKQFPKVNVPASLTNTVLAGIEEDDTAREKIEAAERNIEILGRVPILEIWDRRTKRVIWWAESLDKEIGLQDWPIDFEGLPYTVIQDSPVNEEIAPISEQDITHELQEQLNKMTSMIMTYAKRGVPLIGINENALADGEIEKYERAEILEGIKTNVNPKDAIARFDLTPIPQTLIMAVQTVRDFYREISGQGRIGQGTRENVESGTEAAGIIEALEIRNQDRRSRIEDFLARMVRKDWQVLQQTVTEDLFLDILQPNNRPDILKISVEEMQMEYDLQIEVGSTGPDSDPERKREALQLLALLESPAATFMDPAYIVREAITRFGLPVSEAMATQVQQELKIKQDRFDQLLEGLIGSGGLKQQGAGQSSALGAALDSTKAKPSGPSGGQGV